MKDETITRMSLEEAIRRKGKGQTDWERLRREQEAGVEPEVDPDEGEFDWSQARVVMPPSKQAISVRIENRDVLDFFKSLFHKSSRRRFPKTCVVFGAERPAAS